MIGHDERYVQRSCQRQGIGAGFAEIGVDGDRVEMRQRLSQLAPDKAKLFEACFTQPAMKCPKLQCLESRRCRPFAIMPDEKRLHRFKGVIGAGNKALRWSEELIRIGEDSVRHLPCLLSHGFDGFGYSNDAFGFFKVQKFGHFSIHFKHAFASIFRVGEGRDDRVSLFDFCR